MFIYILFFSFLFQRFKYVTPFITFCDKLPYFPVPNSLIYSNHGNIFNSFCHVSIQICDGVYISTNIPRVLCACQTLLILLI